MGSRVQPMMLARYLAILLLLVLKLILPSVSTADARTISWSGYAWDVRPSGFGAPGPNEWSDSETNVHVDGRDLLLAIVRDAAGRWTSAEVDNQRHFGYGTYRWVVASDLSGLDAYEVLGMFTYGGLSPSNNEIDVEASHWGDLSWPSGLATVWQDADACRHVVRSFPYSHRPPYVNQFTWAPRRISYLVTDASGRTLFRWTVRTGVPTPSSEVPRINLWSSSDKPPTSARRIRISSFKWVPLGRNDLRPVGPDLGSPTRAGVCVSRHVRPASRSLAPGAIGAALDGRGAHGGANEDQATAPARRPSPWPRLSAWWVAAPAACDPLGGWPQAGCLRIDRPGDARPRSFASPLSDGFT